MLKPYILIAGCSHSDSNLSYINFEDFWPNQLANCLDYEVVNLAKGGACAAYVSQQLSNWLSNSNNIQPTLVVAQWPNPYRSMEMLDENLIFSNVNSPTENFKRRLKHNPESFWEEWSQSIIKVNKICKQTLINVCFESADFLQSRLDYFNSVDIKIHIDEKLDGKTWHFDSAAQDNSHHSSWCHSKWTERILTIVNNTV